MPDRNPFIPVERARDVQDKTVHAEKQSKRKLSQHEAKLKAKGEQQQVGSAPPERPGKQDKEEEP